MFHLTLSLREHYFPRRYFPVTLNDLCAVQIECVDSVQMGFTPHYFNPRYEMGLTSVDCSNMILKCRSDSAISNSSVIQKARFKIQILRDSLTCVCVVRFVATLGGERQNKTRFRSSSSWRAARRFSVCAKILVRQCYTGTLFYLNSFVHYFL